MISKSAKFGHFGKNFSEHLILVLNKDLYTTRSHLAHLSKFQKQLNRHLSKKQILGIGNSSRFSLTTKMLVVTTYFEYLSMLCK